MNKTGTFLGAVTLLCFGCGDAAHDTTDGTGSTSTSTSTSQPSVTGDTTNEVPTSTSGDTMDPTGTAAETTDSSSTAGEDLAPRAIVGGTFCSCVLWNSDTFRCWGDGGGKPCTGWGEAFPDNIGDDETPASVGDVPAPFATAALDIGSHSCAVTVDGEVRCWGDNDDGQLGLGDQFQPPQSAAEAKPAFVGPNAVSVTIGEGHTCAVFSDGRLRCWGQNSHGELGYGHTDNIGDDEVPLLSGDVSIGGKAVQVVAGGANLGGAHTCALLESGAVRCWGWTVSDFGEAGAGILGYGNTDNIGDDELPSSVGPLDLGGPVTKLSAGARHTCALRMDGVLLCWGVNRHGRLGLGHSDDIGDDEVPNPAGIVPLAQPVIDMVASFDGACALLEGGTVQCWGTGEFGTHGAGHTMDLGDDETPLDFGPVTIGGAPAIQLAAGRYHVCALLADSALRCWGFNADGQLGYGNTTIIGDDETPVSAGDVLYR